MQRKHGSNIPEDACEHWSAEHQRIASHETAIGDLCDDCFKTYLDDNAEELLNDPEVQAELDTLDRDPPEDNNG